MRWTNQSRMRRRQQRERKQNEDESDGISKIAKQPTNTTTQQSNLLLVCAIALFLFYYFHALRTHHGGVSSSQSISTTLRGGSDNILSIQKKERRTIAIGDIHGDKDALVHALQLANLVDITDGNTWNGGTDIAVQIGDLLNKAEQRDLDTLLYIINIEKQAREAGGGLVVTVGDHDLHNLPKIWHENELLKKEPFPTWMMQVIYIREKTLFVHGSLSRKVFEEDIYKNADGGSIDEMNKEAQAWLAGKGTKPKWLGRGDGPIWSRLYSDKASDEHSNCDELSQLLKELEVDRMIVGHTVRRDGISSICNDKVWRIDVGLSKTESRAGKIGASEVLELSKGGAVATILSTDVKLNSWK